MTDTVDTEVGGRGLNRLDDELRALRTVAALTAEGAPATELFAAVAERVAEVLAVPTVVLLRYDADGSTTVIASLNAPGFPLGSHWPAEGENLPSLIRASARPARIDDYAQLDGECASAARGSGLTSTLGVPITVDGTLWGALCIGTAEREALASDSDDRLREFSELIALAISNAESRDRLHRLADEHAALRRVATLVAKGAPAGELYIAVTQEVAQVLDVDIADLVRYGPGRSMTVLASINDPSFPVGSRWPLDGDSVSARVFDTGRAARIDDFSELPGAIAGRTRASDVSSSAGVPIVVDGAVWGMLAASATESDPLPEGIEDRLRDFTELVATAISNAAAGDRLRRVANEQAALRRVAMLVAEGATSSALGETLVAEVAEAFEVPSVWLIRYEPERMASVVASVNDPGFGIGVRWPLVGSSVTALVHDTGRPARIDDFSTLPGPIAARTREIGITSALAVPITVDGGTWGAVCVATDEAEPLPADLGVRLERFTDLVATAISNAQAHDDLRTLLDEQAALRRVATLVAESAGADEVFAAVCDEAGRLLGLDWIEMVRYGTDGSGTVVAATGEHPFAVGSRWSVDDPSVMKAVLETGRPARIDDYASLGGRIAEQAHEAGFRSAIGVPVVVDGSTWGTIIAISTQPEPVPEGFELRLAAFTELVATAVSNLQAHDDLRSLVEEQAALRRVATLVAEGTDASAIFDAVCLEAGQLVGGSSANLSRYTADGFNVTVAGWRLRGKGVPVGTKLPLAPDTIGGTIVRTRAPARIESWEHAESELARLVRSLGIRSSVGAPVVVDGQLWGALVVATDREEALPVETELRLARFTDLVATAISNAATRSDLIASRARIVAAGDEARRRIERDLHDGTQQRLIALGFDLQRIRGALPSDEPAVDSGLERMEEDLESVIEEIRELSRGLHPPLLSRGGLRPSLRALARRSPIPVELDIDLPERPPAPIETAVYYAVSEALTNASKHSQASTISVTVAADHAGGPFGVSLEGHGRVVKVRATIADDGVGGAEPNRGSGLVGLVDRVDALGGRFALESPAGGGTRISIELPLELPASF